MAGKVVDGKTWEEFISRGMEAREKKDGSQWLLGDLAKEVETTYGEDTMGKYADAIKIEKKSLINYKSIAIKFSPEIRAKYPRLSFSHFSAVTTAEKPEAWLAKAEDEDWNVETLRKKFRDARSELIAPDITETPPEVYRCPECGLWRLKGVSSYEICRGHYKMTKNGLKYN